MAIETVCSGCGQRLAVADQNAGKRARCPACGQIYTIPFPNAPLADEVFPDASQTHSGLAETVAAGNEMSGGAALGNATAEPRPEPFWMKTTEGTEYGPVDRLNLNRWFNEGRVGPGYEIRQGELGPWQPADIFRPPENSASANPYAENSFTPRHAATAINRYQKPDPSALVLTTGILAWVFLVLCWPISWIPGIIAWVSGRSALSDIQAGIADPCNLSLVKVGYYLGMIQVILALLAIIAFAGFIALSVMAQNF